MTPYINYSDEVEVVHDPTEEEKAKEKEEEKKDELQTPKSS